MYLYLNSIGWKVDYAGMSEDAARQDLARAVARCVVGLPSTPLAHGKERSLRWNYFPEELVVDAGVWRQKLAAMSSPFVIPEDPRDPVLRLIKNPAARQSLPKVDLFVWDETQPGEILALDHEGMGPWVLNLDSPVRAVNGDSKENVAGANFEGEEVLRAKGSAIRTWVRQKLRSKGLYIPQHRLVSGGLAEDHLWNYLPECFDVSLENGSFALEAFCRAESVFAWREPVDGYWLLDATNVGIVREVHHAYYLEWPQRRWLLAVPGSYLEDGKDSPVSPSLIVF